MENCVFCNIKDKEDEEIYFVDGSVVKYFYNQSVVKSRLKRFKCLEHITPDLIASNKLT